MHDDEWMKRSAKNEGEKIVVRQKPVKTVMMTRSSTKGRKQKVCTVSRLPVASGEREAADERRWRRGGKEREKTEREKRGGGGGEEKDINHPRFEDALRRMVRHHYDGPG
jgi:hypothetical protein